jgi:Type IV secretion-system coupling protein DNA-binding domain
MPPSNQNPEHGVDPRLPVEQLLHWLAGTTLHCLLGLLLGFLAAREMRARGLHWSCALVIATVILWVRTSAGPWATTLLIGAVVATARGRRWHREDLEAGADLAASARLRTTPIALLARAARALAARYQWPQPRQRGLADERLVIGRDQCDRDVAIPFGASSGRHTLVVGATGSGKTVTQALLASRAIERGMGVVVLDPKGDAGLRDELARAAARADVSLLEWTPQGRSVYNPYAHGSETEIADKMLAGERFTEPHYLRQAQRYLGHAVRALRSSGAEISLRAIVERLEPASLESLARDLPEAQADSTHAYLDALSSRQVSDLAGVRDRLAILAESDVGPWLDPCTVGEERVELLQAIRERAVVYFSLEADRRPLLAQMLGAAIVQDLQTAIAAQQRRPQPTLVVIDEFSAVAAEHVVRLFGRARSAGMSLVLGTQELSDMRLPGRERLLEQVMGNLAVLIAHRQVVPSSAELIADVAGTTGAWKVSRHSDGRSTRTRVREAVLDPSDVIGLAQGCSAVISLDDGGDVRLTRMHAPTVSP